MRNKAVRYNWEGSQMLTYRHKVTGEWYRLISILSAGGEVWEHCATKTIVRFPQFAMMLNMRTGSEHLYKRSR